MSDFPTSYHNTFLCYIEVPTYAATNVTATGDESTIVRYGILALLAGTTLVLWSVKRRAS